jgi:integrase/recombinase XerD
MAGYIERVVGEIAALIAREGLDYMQTKAVFKVARQKAGLAAPRPRRGAPARLNLGSLHESDQIVRDVRT